MNSIVIASNNAGKIREMAALLAARNIRVIGQADAGVEGEAIEDGSTFVENALKKAHYAALKSSTAAIADDSGLCIPALNGEPGLRSARYCDDGSISGDRSLRDTANIEKVLHNLRHIDDRRAYFICVIVLLRHCDDPDPIVARGIWQGYIANKPSGQGGFGYDPIFIGAGMSVSAAELTQSEKSAISHRGKAMSALISQIENRE